MMRPTKIYEHPEFTTEEADLSLFSTICLVLTMVLMGALFVMAFSSFVLWNDGTHCKFIHTISSRSYVDIYTSCFNGLSTRICILGDTKGVPTKPMIRFRVSLSSVSVEDIGADKYAGLPLSSTFPSRTGCADLPLLSKL